MSAVFSKPKAPKPDPELLEAQKRAEERAEQMRLEEAQALSARKRTRRTGGIRLLLSPARGGTAGQSTGTSLGA
jgi:hypothetical protein